jgi:aldehyde:ferredoxin oxidoreductase
MQNTGRILNIDLTDQKASAGPYPTELAPKVLAGRGVNSLFLYERVRPATDAFAPENFLFLSAGFLTGSAAPASARLHVSAKSPLTGALGSSSVGGSLGARLRGCGIQSVGITGRAPQPSLLLIDKNAVRVLPATALWGLDTWRTQEILKKEYGSRDTDFLVIGPAGENRVRYACAMTGRGHAAGRTGMGAVMGSKNLKAIVVKGGLPRLLLSEAAKTAVNDYYRQILQAARYKLFSEMSNTFVVAWLHDMGMLATRNFKQGLFEGTQRIDGPAMLRHVVKRKSCFRCPVHCKAEFSIKDGEFAGIVGERPDLEPTVCLGSKCGVDSVEAILYLHNLCNRLGLDSMSTGSVIAFAMEAYERGIISAEDTGGLKLNWGHHPSMAALIECIADRRGIGDTLAEGVYRAAQKMGDEAGEFAYHSKGMEITGYDPRGLNGTALGFAVSTRGADFTSVYALPEYKWDAEKCKAAFGTEKACERFSVEGKGRLVRHCVIVTAVIDALGICKVPALSLIGDFDLKREAELVSRLTGLALEAQTLLDIGERIFTIERLFNMRHERDLKDTLPAFFSKGSTRRRSRPGTDRPAG